MLLHIVVYMYQVLQYVLLFLSLFFEAFDNFDTFSKTNSKSRPTFWLLPPSTLDRHRLAEQLFAERFTPTTTAAHLNLFVF